MQKPQSKQKFGTKQGVPLAAKRRKMTLAVSVESMSPLIATFRGEACTEL